MSEVQPQPGDKVRVSYEGVVEKVGVETIQLDVGSVHAKHGSGVIEILKRADDPSSDEIGTIRGSHGGASYIRLTQEGDKDWWSLHEFRWVHSVTAGAEPVTGAVPGTPAAQAQQGGRDTEDAHACMEPIRAAFGTPTHCRRPAGHLGNHSPVRSVEDWREVVGP